MQTHRDREKGSTMVVSPYCGGHSTASIRCNTPLAASTLAVVMVATTIKDHANYIFVQHGQVVAAGADNHRTSGGSGRTITVFLRHPPIVVVVRIPIARDDMS
jgi:hypothetical protein